jgi:virulence-associated protein VagC
METATVTIEGDCQSVRLPKGFHIPTTTVFVRHDGENIVLEPIKAKSWPPGFFEAIRIDDESFVRPTQGEVPPVKDL